jgi:hypothetical protein
MPEPVLDNIQPFEDDGVVIERRHKTILVTANMAVYWVLQGHSTGKKLAHGILTKLSADLSVECKTLREIWQIGQNATELLWKHL